MRGLSGLSEKVDMVGQPEMEGLLGVGTELVGGYGKVCSACADHNQLLIIVIGSLQARSDVQGA